MLRLGIAPTSALASSYVSSGKVPPLKVTAKAMPTKVKNERDRHKPAYDEVEVRQLLMHGREMTLLHRIVILAPVADRDDGDKRRDARRDSFNAARERRDKEPVNQLAPVNAR